MRTTKAAMVIAGCTAAAIALASCSENIAGTAVGIRTSATTPTATATTTPSANTTGQAFKIGDDAKFDTAFVGKVKKIRDLPVTGEGLPADDGNRYVGVDVDITNSGTGTEIFTPLLQAELRGPDGKVYDATPLSGAKPDAPNGEIAAKQTVSGTVVFEVPAKYSFDSGAATGFVFLFKGAPGANEDTEIGLG